jgi:hypothetical protein
MSAMFDRLAKIAAGDGSRRDALKRLAGFLAGGFLAVFPTKVKSDDDDHHHHHDHDHDRDHDRHRRRPHVSKLEAEVIDELCLNYCQPCSSLAGGVFGQCFEHCRRSLIRHPGAKLCGTCSAAVPVTVCHGRTPICTASGICV